MGYKTNIGLNDSLHTIKCRICSEVEGNDKILDAKWDSFCKHIGRRKAKKNTRIDVKKRDCYYYKYCKHAKNHKLFTFHNHGSVVTQPPNGMAKKTKERLFNLP